MAPPALAFAGLLWLAPASSAVTGGTVIDVFQPERGYSKTVDVGKPGFSAGDVIFESQPLLDPSDESTVGRATLRLTIVKTVGQEDALVIVDYTAQLADGNISGYGPFKFSDLTAGATFAVTGGTGIYDQVRGSVTVTEEKLNGVAGATLSFHIFTT